MCVCVCVCVCDSVVCVYKPVSYVSLDGGIVKACCISGLCYVCVSCLLFN